MSQPNWRPNPPHREPTPPSLVQQAEPLLRAILNRHIAVYNVPLQEVNKLEFEKVVLNDDMAEQLNARDPVSLASEYEVSVEAAEAMIRLAETPEGVAELRHAWDCLVLSGLPTLASPVVATANSLAIALEDGTVIHVLGGCRVGPGTPLTEATLLALQQNFEHQLGRAIREVGLEGLRQNVVDKIKFHWDATQVHPADLLRQGLAHFIRHDPQAQQMERALLPYVDLLAGILNHLAPRTLPTLQGQAPSPRGGISG